MSFYQAKIPVSVGEIITFDDGPAHVVVDYGEFSDERIVESDGERQPRHIDWFYEMAAEADEIHIYRS